MDVVSSASSELSPDAENRARIENYLKSYTTGFSPSFREYLMDNLVALFDSAFQLTYNPKISIVCMLIIKKNDTEFNIMLQKSPILKNYVMNFVKNIGCVSMRSQELFLDYLLWIASNSEYDFFTAVVEPHEFMRHLVDSIYLESVYNFLTSFVKLHHKKIFAQHKIQLHRWLLDSYFINAKGGRQAIQLFMSCLTTDNLVDQAGKSLLGFDSFLVSLVLDCFDESNPRSADLLASLYETSLLYITNSKWSQIEEYIAYKYTDICHALTYYTHWLGYQKHMGRLWLLMTREKRIINEKMFQVVAKSVDFMFDNPLSSIQHNFALEATLIFVDYGGPVGLLLEKTRLPERLIANYKNRDFGNRMFWGQLRIIAETVNKFVSRSQYPEWETAVVAQNKRIDEIIQRRTAGLFDLFFARHRNTQRSKRMLIWIAAFLLMLLLFGSCLV